MCTAGVISPKVFSSCGAVHLFCYLIKFKNIPVIFFFNILIIWHLFSDQTERHALTHLDGDISLWTVASVPVHACESLCCGCCSTLLFIPRTHNSNESSSARKRLWSLKKTSPSCTGWLDRAKCADICKLQQQQPPAAPCPWIT